LVASRFHYLYSQNSVDKLPQEQIEQANPRDKLTTNETMGLKLYEQKLKGQRITFTKYFLGLWMLDC